jgi:hypothetical protein
MRKQREGVQCKKTQASLTFANVSANIFSFQTAKKPPNFLLLSKLISAKKNKLDLETKV